MDCLQELRAFLLVRKPELASSSLAALLGGHMPEAVQQVDAASAGAMLAAVEAALAALK